MAISMNEYKKIMYTIQNFTDDEIEQVKAEYIANGYEAARKKINEIIDKRNTHKKPDGFEPSI